MAEEWLLATSIEVDAFSFLIWNEIVCFYYSHLKIPFIFSTVCVCYLDSVHLDTIYRCIGQFCVIFFLPLLHLVFTRCSIWDIHRCVNKYNNRTRKIFLHVILLVFFGSIGVDSFFSSSSIHWFFSMWHQIDLVIQLMLVYCPFT